MRADSNESIGIVPQTAPLGSPDSLLAIKTSEPIKGLEGPVF